MPKKIKLTKKQKMYLFTCIMDASDIYKIFEVNVEESNELDWLIAQNVYLEENGDWYDLYVGKELYTSLNSKSSEEIDQKFDCLLCELDQLERCWWCGEWCDKDYMYYWRRDWLCENDYDYLVGREGIRGGTKGGY